MNNLYSQQQKWKKEEVYMWIQIGIKAGVSVGVGMRVCVCVCAFACGCGCACGCMCACASCISVSVSASEDMCMCQMKRHKKLNIFYSVSKFTWKDFCWRRYVVKNFFLLVFLGRSDFVEKSKHCTLLKNVYICIQSYNTSLVAIF